jgi:hypothetical protein
LIKLCLAALILVFWGCAFSGTGAQPAIASSRQQSTASAPIDKSQILVYVSDFELHAQPRNTSSTGAPSTGAASAGTAQNSASSGKPQDATKAPTQAVPGGSQNPEEQASKLVNLLSTSLVEVLEKAGYTVRRALPGEARPAQGVMIRGVFAEADERNHVRRAILGSGSPAPRFLVYAGVQNLKRPDQPLYELANPQAPGVGPPDSRYGPVITVTSYAPAAKFELAKDPSNEEVKKMASQIVTGLTDLLNANPAAVTP